MKSIQRFTICALFALCSLYASAYDFSAENEEGVTIYYNIYSETEKTVEVTYKNTNYNSYSGSISIPENVNFNGVDYVVTRLGNYSFDDCYNLESITLPSNLTTIGRYCFYYCTSLTSISIPKSVNSLVEYCFRDCESLSSITVYWENLDNLSVGVDIFGGIYGSPTLYVPKGTLELYALTSPWSEFYNIVEDTDEPSVSPIQTIDNIRYYLYDKGEATIIAQSSELEGTLNLPNVVTFDGADYTVTNILSKAFSKSNVSSLSLPSSITSLPDYCFEDFTSLESIYIPNSITSLPSDCFYGCTSLSIVDLPNSLTILGSNCFRSCRNLESISLPSSLTTIGSYCFYYCTSLSCITSLNIVPPSCSSNAFEHVPDDCVLIVPDEALYTYANTDVWKDFLPYYTAPQVTTYDAEEINTYSTIIKGFVREGYEQIIEQGFEIWYIDSEVNKIYVEDSLMIVELKDLLSKTSYTYHAYARTPSVTIYGEDKTFTTPSSIEDIYEETLEDITASENILNEAWETITTDYADVADGFKEDYEAIGTEIETLRGELEEAYKDGTLDEGLAEEIRSKLEEIKQEIEELLAAAKKAHEELDGITGVFSNFDDDVQIYNISGTRINTPTKGNVYIFRYSDGTTKKLFIK